MKLKLTALALAATGALTCAPSFAANTHTLTVSAAVAAVCNFNTAGPTTLTVATAAGVINPSAAGPATGTAAVTFRCTTGTTSAVAADNGLNFTAGSRRVKNGTNFMPYTLAMTNAAQVGTGFGAGQDKTVSITANIVAANYQNAAAATYTDTVVLSITP